MAKLPLQEGSFTSIAMQSSSYRAAEPLANAAAHPVPLSRVNSMFFLNYCFVTRRQPPSR